MVKHRRAPSPIWGRALAKAMAAASSKDLRTQTGLAKKSGVAQSTIGRIIRGEVNPEADNLQRLAEALEIPFAQLFGTAPVESVDSVTAPPRDPRYEETAAALAAVEEILRRFEAVVARWRRQWGYSR